ncbi:MAG: hypothetical protein PHQ23_03750 [Candidatus Wallbacteria bacterium]|nr:hypothetical protein [Candidatus Wallbacteria bacterium]
MNEKSVKDWMENWEKAAGDWMEEVTKSQHFIRGMLETYEPLFDVSKNYNVAREKWFETVGISSKQDSVRIAQQIVNLETRIADLQEQIAGLSTQNSEILKAVKTSPTQKTVKSKKIQG